MLPMVRISSCGHQSNNPIIISSSPTGKKHNRRTRLWECLGIRTRIYASKDAGFCVPENPEFIIRCSECLSFPHCQYTASLDLDTIPEIFRSAIIGNYDWEKGLRKSSGLKFYAIRVTVKIIFKVAYQYKTRK